MCAWIYGCNDAINSPLKIWGYIGLLRPRITTCYALQKTYRRNRRQNARRASVRSPRSGTEGRTALALACLPAIGVASEATPFLVLGEGYKKHGKKVVKKGGMCGRVKQRGKAVTESDGSKTRGKTDTLLSPRARALYPEGIIFHLSISPWDLPKSKGQQGLARGRESCSAFVHVNSRLMTPSGC